MSGLWIAALGGLAAAAIAGPVQRRSVRRREDFRRRFAALLDEARPGLSVRAAQTLPSAVLRVTAAGLRLES